MTQQKSKTAKTAKVTNVQVTEAKQIECFQVLKHEGSYKIILGNSQITIKEFKTMEEAEKYIKSKPYELILNSALYLVHKMNEEQSKK